MTAIYFVNNTDSEREIINHLFHVDDSTLFGHALRYALSGYRNAEDYFDVSMVYTFLDGEEQEKATFGLSLFNIYNRQNIWYKEYDIVDTKLVGSDIKFLGFTPNLTFTIKF